MLTYDIIRDAENLKTSIKCGNEGYNLDFVEFTMSHGVSQRIKNKALAQNIKFIMTEDSSGLTAIKESMFLIIDEVLADISNDKNREEKQLVKSEKSKVEKQLTQSLFLSPCKTG